MFLIEFEGYDLTKYNEFLVECSLKDYSNEKTHKHHILPRFMGGNNRKDNLLILNYEDHCQSHVILAECFPKKSPYYTGNYFAACILQKWIVSPIDYGDRLKGIPRPKWIIDKLIKSRLGKKHTEEHKKYLSETLKHLYATGQKIPNFGDVNSPGRIEYRRRQSVKMRECQNGKDNPSARKIQHVESGKVFDCLKDAMIEFGLKNYNKIRSEIKKGNFRILGEYSSTEKMKENNSKSKQIIHIETGEVFRSMSQASEKFNITFPILYRLINQGIFKYVNSENINPPNTSTNPKTKSVIDLNSGQIFNSVKSLRNEFGFTQWEFEKRVKRGEISYV